MKLDRLAVPFVLACALPFTARAQAPAAAPAAAPVVVTTGQAVVRRAPDRAFVSVTVESRASSPREAQRANAAAMTGVMPRILDAGVPKDAVRTASYTVEPEWDFAGGRRTLRDYVARNTVEVRLDDIQRVGELLDVVVGSGATSVGDIRFDLKDRAAAERDALRAAVADARSRAEALASAAGVTLGPVLRLQEEGTEAGGPRPMVEMAAVRAAAPATPVSGGEIEIRARVALTVAIK
jgi:uncharacterized protein YggE